MALDRLVDELRLGLEDPAIAELERMAAFERCRPAEGVALEGPQESTGIGLRLEPCPLEDTVEIPAGRSEMGPVGAKRLCIDAPGAGVHAGKVGDIAFDPTERRVNACVVSGAVLMHRAIDVEAELEGDQIVIVVGSTTEDAEWASILVAMNAHDPAPAGRKNSGAT